MLEQEKCKVELSGIMTWLEINIHIQKPTSLRYDTDDMKAAFSQLLLNLNNCNLLHMLYEHF